MYVVVYGTTNCVKCSMAKQLLSSKNIPYEFVNLDEHKELLEDLTAKVWPNASLPIVSIDGQLHAISTMPELSEVLEDKGGCFLCKL